MFRVVLRTGLCIHVAPILKQAGAILRPVCTNVRCVQNRKHRRTFANDFKHFPLNEHKQANVYEHRQLSEEVVLHKHFGYVTFVAMALN